MFTGIIRHLGSVKQLKMHKDQALLVITSPGVFVNAQPGDSVAINGTCLTIVKFNADEAQFELGPATLQKTNLKNLQPGEKVNLELPLLPTDQLGGHFVQGHIDATAKITKLEKQPGGTLYLQVQVPSHLLDQVIDHGSIALDGVSLTVAKLEKDLVTIMLMSYTLDHTNLADKKIGDELNLEIDMLAKYVKNLIKQSTLPA